MEKAEIKEKTKNSIRKEFFEAYRKEVCPVLKEFEVERRGIIASLWIVPIMEIIIFATVAFLLESPEPSEEVFLILLKSILFIVCSLTTIPYLHAMHNASKAASILKKWLLFNSWLVCAVICTIGGPLVLIMAFMLTARGVEVIIFALITIIIAAIIMSAVYCLATICFNLKIKSFHFVLKDRCLAPVLQAFGNISWHKDEEIISDEQLVSSKLFATFNKKIIDDEFSGEYKGISFKVSETKMFDSGGIAKSKNLVDVFSGIILTFTLNKNFETDTMISTKGDLTSKDNTSIILIFILLGLFGFFETFIKVIETKGSIFTLIFLGAYLTICFIFYFKEKNHIKKEKMMDKVVLEDVKFNKKFEVYSQDQIEGRCYVTPAFMERFVNLNTAFGAKKAKCAFFQNQIMFAISTSKNLFEIGSLNKSLLDFNTFENFYKEINAIYEMIDYFKLGKN